MVQDFALGLHLTVAELLILGGICFCAGVVRGFSGFALSAVVMAAAALIIPPVELIPICWWLEIAASVMMIRGGWAEANKKVAIVLGISSGVAVQLGVYLTLSLSLAASKLAALILIVLLAVLQLAKVRLPFLASNAGLVGSGAMAGIATGLASVGGMVVALYVLARDMPAREMRGTLVLFLFIGASTSLIAYLASGVMDQIAALRGIALILPAMFGVFIGKLIFIPKWERYYRPFCLSLLICLAGFGVMRLVSGI